MYILQDELKLNEWQFSQRKYLPYEIKVKLAEARIREWYENWYGEVYLSYSGGVDWHGLHFNDSAPTARRLCACGKAC